MPTDIPFISGPAFAQRLATLFPRGWAGDDAVQSGNVYALFLSAGNEISGMLEEIQYAALAQRMQTETSPELDLASIDFFGTALPRPSGMSDTAFDALIVSNLFKAAATRAAISAAIQELTGVTPRMMEPWNIFDTGVWGRTSYWNVDSSDYPARWGNGGLRYQGFIETAPAQVPVFGANVPILGWGDSAYWNVPGYFFGIIGNNTTLSVYDVINKVRAYGTLVWVKFVAQPSQSQTPPPTAPGIVGGITATATGPTSIQVNWTAPTGTAPFNYTVLIATSSGGPYTAAGTVQLPTFNITGLTNGVTYFIEVQAANTVGSSVSAPISAAPSIIPPGPALNLTATQVQATAVTLMWTAPSVGTPPFSYVVQYRVFGTTPWSTFNVSAGATGVTVIGLIPSTTYEFEVLSTN